MRFHSLVFLIYAYFEALYNTFRYADPGRGPLMQTLLTGARAKRLTLPRHHRRVITLEDGQPIALDALPAPDPKTAPNVLILINHGLGGDYDSPATRYTTAQIHKANFNIITYNRRGHGGLKAHRPPHLTEPDDLRQVLTYISTLVHPTPIILVGLSAGGNDTLKYIAAFPDHAPKCNVIKAITVSSLLTPNPIAPWYVQGLSSDFLYDVLVENTHLPSALAVTQIPSWDCTFNTVNAILHPDVQVQEYQQRMSAGLDSGFNAIKIPITLLQAKDDPFLHTPIIQTHGHSHVLPNGGHVGPKVVDALVSLLHATTHS